MRGINNFKQNLHMTHLSLFLFFDADLSSEKVVYYLTNFFLLLIKNTQRMEGKHISLINIIMTVCLAYQYRKIRFLILLWLFLYRLKEKKTKQSQSQSILFKELKKLKRSCNQRHALTTRLELTLHNWS